ncbi:MAG: class II fructose-bisphosphate aldolase, partial [Methylobacteriaceae bacterium]|nr:class II fructose-bisphosphate aldolase [Methylobacteriaceae bacterium]
IGEEAHKRGVNLETEIGVLGGSEGGLEAKTRYTDPDEAVRFSRECGCDALAVAIGNAHGHYKVEPKLQFDVLDAIHRRIDVPLVLHGGTGISDGDFQKAVAYGVRKINIATAIFDAMVHGADLALKSGGRDTTYFSLNEQAINSVYNVAKHYIHVFSGAVAPKDSQ